MLNKNRLLNILSIFNIVLMFLIIYSCEQPEERLWNNPYDSDSDKDLWAPTNLMATQQDIREVRLQWKDNSGISESNTPDEVGYRINRLLENKDWEMDYAELGPNQTTWVDSMSVPGRNKYGVYAFAGGNSSSTATVDITTSFPAPTNFEASQSAYNKVKLSWDDANADGYRIERKHDNGSWENAVSLWLDPGSLKEWTDFSFTHGSQLSYRIYGLIDEIQSSPAEAIINKANLVLIDDFSSSKIENWDMRNSEAYWISAVDGTLELGGTDDGFQHYAYLLINDFTSSEYNFITPTVDLFVDVKMKSEGTGDASIYGIGLREYDSGSRWYFLLSKSGWTKFSLYSDDEWSDMIDWTLPNPTIGSNNNMHLSYDGDLFSIYLNDVIVTHYIHPIKKLKFDMVYLYQQQDMVIQYDNVELYGNLSNSAQRSSYTPRIGGRALFLDENRQ